MKPNLMKLLAGAVAPGVVVLVAQMVPAKAEDPPKSPQKYTIPGMGGYGWTSGAPESPHNVPPATGSSVGFQYPPNRATKLTCSNNGKPVDCGVQ
jgi:hypothetical protein